MKFLISNGSVRRSSVACKVLFTWNHSRTQCPLQMQLCASGSSNTTDTKMCFSPVPLVQAHLPVSKQLLSRGDPFQHSCLETPKRTSAECENWTNPTCANSALLVYPQRSATCSEN